MKTSSRLLLGAALVALGLNTACTTHHAERRPVVVYPVTYDVPVGNTQVHAASAGSQNLRTSSSQQVTADVGDPLYYQVVSPVPVIVSIYERPHPSRARVLLREFQGTTFTDSITPRTEDLEFMFEAQQPNSAGTLQFTLSDRPIAPAVKY